MRIVDFAEKELKFNLSCIQKDLLKLLENDSDFLRYVKKKSHTMVQVIDIYDKWSKNKFA
ncbi:hypothetical protein O9H85_35140 [Paenibacillus filicis]|uniref:Uncharacterized protein n=1 Tax=Paenibacillus gyeongsangnamensis TaxID=3388067 RepID=A0ABT4QKT3_9BACL|nr:hypothetical protein [Paenibacillus filicis]MCZ8517486.1 hypothetical protein [Paenibacillus filicis]